MVKWKRIKKLYRPRDTERPYETVYTLQLNGLTLSVSPFSNKFQWSVSHPRLEEQCGLADTVQAAKKKAFDVAWEAQIEVVREIKRNLFDMSFSSSGLFYEYCDLFTLWR